MSLSTYLQVERRYFHTAVGFSDYMAIMGGFTQFRNSSEKILIYKYRCNYWYTLDLSGKFMLFMSPNSLPGINVLKIDDNRCKQTEIN